MRVLAGGVLLFLSLLPGSIQAGPAEDRAAADALFEEGRALIEQGKYAEACAKFAACQKLDPTPGTLLTLGDCYERNGQTASAWATFNEAGSLARQRNDAVRAAEAARRKGLVEPKLSKLMVEVPPESRVAGLEVRRNGAPINEAALGSAIPVDPGPQAIEASAPGKTGWSTKVDVASGVVTVRVPPLADVAPEPRVTAPKPPVVEAKPARPWQRPLGIAGMGAGALGVGVGAVLGGVALSKKGESNDGHCFPNNRCDQVGLDLRASALGLGNASTALFIAGGVVLTGGVVLFATAPSREKQAGAAPGPGWSATFKVVPGGFQTQVVW
jgi:hypothetical protein